MPPCMYGCRVFTRPSSISGKLVSCSTLVTETPAFSKALAVPPVETIVYPKLCNPLPRRAKSVLSDSEINARLAPEPETIEEDSNCDVEIDSDTAMALNWLDLDFNDNN
uniref:Uncharacterized protein n=1 Tax=Opuntia streptacantha TaxID=393608 RepID=A0A7C9AZS4_OPUST